MRQYWLGERKWGQLERKVKRAPFGRHLGFEYEWDEEKKKYYRSNETRMLPIQGPPNWDQMWNEWPQAGRDFMRVFLFGPLHQDMMPFVDQYVGRISNIKFDSKLGSGTYGEVWSVDCTITATGYPTKLACKVMRLKARDVLSNMVQRVNSVLNDVQTLCTLNHPNIVRYLDIITIPDSKTQFPFAAILVFMQICQGDLIRIMNINGGPLAHEICQHWMRQIGDAVRYLHRRDIVHFDIKPDNILYRFAIPGTQLSRDVLQHQWNNIIFKLTDFGFARCFTYFEPQLTTNRRGTEGFMAPELISSAQLGVVPAFAKPCDIYALGMSLALCLMSVDFKPYADNYAMANYMVEILNGQVVSQHITPAVAWLIYKMTCHDVYTRYNIDQVLSDPYLTGAMQYPAPPQISPLKRYSDQTDYGNRKKKFHAYRGL